MQRQSWKETRMKEDLYMLESVTITVPRKKPPTKRISEVSKQISEWLKSLEKPFDYRTNMLRLKKCELSNNEYIYHYEIHRKVKDQQGHGVGVFSNGQRPGI